VGGTGVQIEAQLDIHLSFLADVDAQLVTFLSSDELIPYRSKQTEIKKAFESHVAILWDELQPLAAKLFSAKQRNEQAKARSAIGLKGAIGLVLSVLALAVAANSLASDIRDGVPLVQWLPPFSLKSVSMQRAFLVLSLGTGAFASGYVLQLFRLDSAEKASARTDLVAVQNQYASALQSAVREAVGLAIGALFRGSGILMLPTVAPTLVELTSAKIVDSKAHLYVRDFIKAHESSAVGIAGDRGAGKSTLMKAIQDDKGVAGVSLYMSAPVHYDAVDFTRRLFYSAAEKLLEHAGSPYFNRRRSGQRRARSMRMITTGLLMYIGAAFALVGFFTTSTRLNTTTLVGLALAGYGFLGFSRLTVLAPSRRTSLSDRPFERLAAEAIETLEWDIEESEKNTEALTLGKSLLQFQSEDSATRRRRARSHPDLVDDFRRMLSEFSNEPDAASFVIVVDELDKLSTRDELIEAINGLKDLFHLPNVHFLVSVSTDALASFEERGFDTRDAFDSAFDSIVLVERLIPDESVRIVSARAPGFPIPLALFCHAWSGGLPRDLLRTARRCVEMQRRASTALPAIVIIRQIVLQDLETFVLSKTKRAEAGSRAQNLVAVLRTLRELGRSEPETGQAFSQNLKSTTLPPAEIDDIVALVEVGFSTLAYFARDGVLTADLNGLSEISSAAEDFAQARHLLGVAALRDAAVDRVSELSGLRS
jgi:hypothetical protein